MSASHPYDVRREALARLLAASFMELTADPTGTKLPAKCWRQMLKKADATLFLLTPPDIPDHHLARAKLVQEQNHE